MFSVYVGIVPAGTRHWNNVNSTLIQREDVESTLNLVVIA